ncbi:hypothetical protein KAR91_72835 [Candidatus Pacearchaeota archaeon]|nr:hypothetical protein [Candidatus Pacearchaeota archaeon]
MTESTAIAVQEDGPIVATQFFAERVDFATKEDDLPALTEQYKGLNCDTKEGYKSTKAALTDLRKRITETRKQKDSAKRPHLDFNKAVDTRFKAIETGLKEIMSPMLSSQAAEDERRANAAAAIKERQLNNLHDIRTMTGDVASMSINQLLDAHEKIESIDLMEIDLGEYRPEAGDWLLLQKRSIEKQQDFLRQQAIEQVQRKIEQEAATKAKAEAEEKQRVIDVQAAQIKALQEAEKAKQVAVNKSVQSAHNERAVLRGNNPGGNGLAENHTQGVRIGVEPERPQIHINGNTGNSLYIKECDGGFTVTSTEKSCDKLRLQGWASQLEQLINSAPLDLEDPVKAEKMASYIKTFTYGVGAVKSLI